MKPLKFLLLPFSICILLFSCSKFDGNNNDPCPKIDSIYYRLDSVSKSLINIYHQGDTIKFRDSLSGTLHYFIVQKPESGFLYKKDPASIYYNCPGNDWFLEWKKVYLLPVPNTSTGINIQVYFENNIPTLMLKVTTNDGDYKCGVAHFPLSPGTTYYDSVFINNNIYRNVQKVGFSDDWPPKAYLYYNLPNGLIRLTLPSGEIYDLEL